MINSKVLEKILATCIVLVVLGTIAYLIYLRTNTEQKTVRAGVLPDFRFETLEGERIEAEDFKDRKLVIAYFNPSCGHCQNLSADLSSRAAAFKGVSFLFISKADEIDIRNFERDYSIKKLSDAHMIRVGREEFYGFFGEEYVPLVLLYNEEAKRVGRCMEDCTAYEIMEKLNL